MKLLRIQTPLFVAGCVWILRDGRWRVDPNQCAPLLRWMVGLKPEVVYSRLQGRQRDRWEWMWVRSTTPPGENP